MENTNALHTIFTRKSVREFASKAIAPEDIHTILRAGMSGPTCVNARQWSFLVVTQKEKLQQMAAANGRPAMPLNNAPLGILVCGDTKRAFAPAPEYWVIDCAIAAQNMTLAAQALGIGSVWLGTWPQMERVKRQQELFQLPDEVIPHSILAFGYPLEKHDEERDLFEADRVHYEIW